MKKHRFWLTKHPGFFFLLLLELDTSGETLIWCFNLFYMGESISPWVVELGIDCPQHAQELYKVWKLGYNIYSCQQGEGFHPLARVYLRKGCFNRVCFLFNSSFETSLFPSFPFVFHPSPSPFFGLHHHPSSSISLPRIFYFSLPLSSFSINWSLLEDKMAKSCPV